MQHLIQHGADVKAQDETRLTPLHLASSLGIPEIVQLMIECGADVTSLDWTEQTPLHIASSWVSPKTVFLSIKHRAYVMDQNAISYLPLNSTFLEKTGTIRMLIDHGADVTAQDETRSTPLHIASAMGIIETVRLLIEHGADITARDVHCMTPLHMASSWVSGESMQFLMQ